MRKFKIVEEHYKSGNVKYRVYESWKLLWIFTVWTPANSILLHGRRDEVIFIYKESAEFWIDKEKQLEEIREQNLRDKRLNRIVMKEVEHERIY
jgi:hypothetical protein